MPAPALGTAIEKPSPNPSLVQRGFLLAAIIADALGSQLYDSVARL